MEHLVSTTYLWGGSGVLTCGVEVEYLLVGWKWSTYLWGGSGVLTCGVEVEYLLVELGGVLTCGMEVEHKLDGVGFGVLTCGVGGEDVC